ncbi:MAG: hypothetical protein ABI791_06650 [Acidobacteriota bacterium]
MKRITANILLSVIFTACCIPAAALGQDRAAESYRNIELLEASGERTRETNVRIEFRENSMAVVSASNGTVIKEMKYEDITAAEYSYTKNPRWKTGLGLGAAAFVFPPLFLIAIPIGFTKHRRHWVTVRTKNDFAVLKVGKGIRKMFIPAFETHSAVKISALGEDK